MRIWLSIFFLIALAAVGVAGYVGYQTQQPPPPAGPQKPVTIPVSRGDVEQTVAAPGQLVGTRERVLTAEVNGLITHLNVRPGSVVRDGDVLLRLDPQPFQDALTRAQIALEEAAAEAEQRRVEAELISQASEALVVQAQAQYPSLTAAEVRRQAAREAEERALAEYNKALDRPWEPEHVVEAYRLEWVNLQRQREVAEAEYNAVLNQRWAVGQEVEARRTDAERAALQAAYLAESGVSPLLRLAVDEAKRALAATTITAPFDGVVLDVRVKPGESAGAGQALLLMADPTAAEVRTTVIEEDLPLVQPGQPAELFFDARPDTAVAGRVDRIVPQRIVGESRPLYDVYIALTDPLPQGVMPGMTADASIIIDARADVLRLPRALVRSRADATATLAVWQDGAVVERAVTTGLRGDVFTEIVSGLQAGDEVVAD